MKAVLAALLCIQLPGLASSPVGAFAGERANYDQLRQRAESGTPEDQLRWAQVLLSHHAGLIEGGSRREEVRAGLEWLEKSSQRGNLRAMAILGRQLLEGDGDFLEAEPDRGRQLLTKAAEGGDLSAQHGLGVYLVQIGFDNASAELEEGLAWVRRAATAGSPDAQRTLASYYTSGIGVPQSAELSYQWIKKAAEGGDAPAAMWMARHLEADSPAKVLHWYRVAAENGDWDAQRLIGRRLLFGSGTEADRVDGLAWLEIRACSGDVDSMYDLALAYSGRVPTILNPVRALQWTLLAERRIGPGPADPDLAELERSLRKIVPQSQIGQIESWAASWRLPRRLPLQPTPSFHCTDIKFAGAAER